MSKRWHLLTGIAVGSLVTQVYMSRVIFAVSVGLILGFFVGLFIGVSYSAMRTGIEED